jgi:poly-beta-1,6-N-acetyl-D-glucosamine synthase
MCNGANLAYERSVFLEVNGFEGIDEIPSGDDMLLMHKIFQLYPNDVHYLKHSDAIVDTPPESSWKMFFHQRIRWASKAVHYEDKKIFYALLLTYLINICFVALAIAAIIDRQWFSFLLLLLMMKVLIEFPFVNDVAIFFRQQRLLMFFPFLQPLHIIYIVVAGWLGRFGSYKWKSRTIKNKGKTKLAKQ